MKCRYPVFDKNKTVMVLCALCDNSVQIMRAAIAMNFEVGLRYDTQPIYLASSITCFGCHVGLLLRVFDAMLIYPAEFCVVLSSHICLIQLQRYYFWLDSEQWTIIICCISKHQSINLNEVLVKKLQSFEADLKGIDSIVWTRCSVNWQRYSYFVAELLSV